MCRLLNVSKSGFYAWDGRALSARARADIGLSAKIHAIHRRSRGAYGAPSIHAELADDHAVRVGRKRVARLLVTRQLREEAADHGDCLNSDNNPSTESG
jgi:hypothetical protein